jgi:DNA-binding CsgD family transcriptional regulator
LPEKAEVIDRASDRQTGNANGARRSEHSIQPRDRILLRRTASGQSKNSTAGQH